MKYKKYINQNNKYFEKFTLVSNKGVILDIIII